MDKEHADKFGHLIVQTFDGRFEPVHTLAYDVLHKIYKKNSIKVEGKGKLNGMQFYMDLMTDSEFWKTKITRNQDVDVRNYKALKKEGWRILTIWECSIKGKNQIGVENVVDRAENWLEYGIRARVIKGVM